MNHKSTNHNKNWISRISDKVELHMRKRYRKMLAEERSRARGEYHRKLINHYEGEN
jgi:hypothetical protein